MSDELLQVENLERHFDGLKAVDGVSFTVSPGEVVAIIGPNGSGKTTTLNLVTGTIPSHGGSTRSTALASIRRPRRPSQSTASPARSRTAGCSRRCPSPTTSRSASTRPCTRAGRSADCRTCSCCAGSPSSASCSSRSWEHPPRVGSARRSTPPSRRRSTGSRHVSGHAATTPAYSLSYANRRRTEIARAMALSPKLLVLDEPTAGMNQSETAEVLAQLLELKAEGQAILLVEHKIDLVMTVSDRIIVMDGGRIIAEGDPRSVRGNPAVIEAYLGRRRGHDGEGTP